MAWGGKREGAGRPVGWRKENPRQRQPHTVARCLILQASVRFADKARLEILGRRKHIRPLQCLYREI